MSNATYPIPNFTGAVASTTISPGWDWYIHKAPYVVQYNLNFQREVSEGTVVTVGYVGSHGVDLITQQERNPPTPVIDAKGVYHFATLVNGAIRGNPRLNPNLGFLQMSVTGTTSRYNSLQSSLSRRLTRNIQAQINYTFSRCTDDGGSPLGSINGGNSPTTYENPFDRSFDRGLCYFNTTHTFRANGLVNLPFHSNRVVEGWQVSGAVTWNSGLPLTIGDGFDQVGFGYVIAGNPRPNYIPGCKVEVGQVNRWYNPACFTIEPAGTLGNLGRNTLIGPGLAQVDFALLKDTKVSEKVRVQFRAEFFNLSNHPQFGQPGASVFTAGPNGTGNPNALAGQITTLATNTAARQIQFALKFLF